MSTKCSIVKDLLPLYVEDMVSDETAKFIEEHLKTCSECKKLLNTMKGSNEEVIINDKSKINDDRTVIKNVKSKLKKKNILTIALTIFVTLGSIFGYFILEPYFVNTKIVYGESEIYSEQDKEDAIDVILQQFEKFEGCVLYEISYTGDSNSSKNLDYVNDLAPEGVVFTQCIVFDTEFKSPIFGGGAWSANRTYLWTWYLGRTEGGNWQLLTYGVG